MMNGELAAAQRWVNRVVSPDVMEKGEGVNEQARVTELADKWRKWWEAAPKELGELDELMGNVGRVEGCPIPIITGGDLGEYSRKQVAKRRERMGGRQGSWRNYHLRSMKIWLTSGTLSFREGRCRRPGRQ